MDEITLAPPFNDERGNLNPCQSSGQIENTSISIPTGCSTRYLDAHSTLDLKFTSRESARRHKLVVGLVGTFP